MSRAHAEIAYQITRLGRLTEDIGDRGPDASEIADLRGALYGLHAILRLHTVQEDETYLSLGDSADARPADRTVEGQGARSLSSVTGSVPGLLRVEDLVRITAARSGKPHERMPRRCHQPKRKRGRDQHRERDRARGDQRDHPATSAVRPSTLARLV